MSTELEKLVALHRKLTEDHYQNPSHDPTIWMRPVFDAMYSAMVEMRAEIDALRIEVENLKKENRA